MIADSIGKNLNRIDGVAQDTREADVHSLMRADGLAAARLWAVVHFGNHGLPFAVAGGLPALRSFNGPLRGMSRASGTETP